MGSGKKKSMLLCTPPCVQVAFGIRDNVYTYLVSFRGGSDKQE